MSFVTHGKQGEYITHVSSIDAAEQSRRANALKKQMSNTEKWSLELFWLYCLAVIVTGWTQGASARSYQGGPTNAIASIDEGVANCFCSSGAIRLVDLYNDDLGSRKEMIENRLAAEILKRTSDDQDPWARIIPFNDSHSFVEVVQLWRDVGTESGWDESKLYEIAPWIRKGSAFLAALI
jgi:hypothetical protein